VNARRRVEITDGAQRQIAAAAAWWAENRPAAPAAVQEELDEALDLLSLQPDIGSVASRPTLPGVRRLTLSRIRYYVYYRVVGSALQILAFSHTSRGSGPPI
jgi:plasmid stabilization system protein ParE